MVKSAASAASRKTKSRGPRPGKRLDIGPAYEHGGRGASLGLGALDLVLLEATLAADLVSASKSFRGGCASSRLDHGSPEIA